MHAVYTSQFDHVTGQWQILSRSGHVVYESADGEYVRAVCRELCALGVRNVVVEAGPTDRDSCYV
jgi:hypothetical protein